MAANTDRCFQGAVATLVQAQDPYIQLRHVGWDRTDFAVYVSFSWLGGARDHWETSHRTGRNTAPRDTAGHTVVERSKIGSQARQTNLELPGILSDEHLDCGRTGVLGIFGVV